MIYTIEDLLTMLRGSAEHGDGAYLLPENLATLVAYLDTVRRLSDTDNEKLLGRIAWLETSMVRSKARAAHLLQELDAACPHS